MITIVTFHIAGLKFFETSAKDNVNVKAVFDLMVDIILEKMAESSDHDGAMAGQGASGGKILNFIKNLINNNC